MSPDAGVPSLGRPFWQISGLSAVRSRHAVSVGSVQTSRYRLYKAPSSHRGWDAPRGQEDLARLPRVAAGRGISLATLSEQPKLDVAIDGADEVDPFLNVVKGRGGALLREKVSFRQPRTAPLG